MTFVNLGYKIHYTRGDDLVAAAELPLNGTGDYFHVSGSTTITSLASLETGMQVILYFEDAVTVQHSANLILPEGSNIDAVEGDTLRFLSETPGTWRLVGGSYGGGHSPDPEPAIHKSLKSSASLGSPLNGNGDFAFDLSQWTGDWTWSSDHGGSADGAGATILQQDLNVVDGGVYYGEMNIVDRTTGYITVEIGTYLVPFNEDDYNFDTNGTYSASLKAYSTGATSIIVRCYGGFDGKLTYLRLWNLDPATPAVTILDAGDTEAAHMIIDDTLTNLTFGRDSGFYVYSSRDNIALGSDAGWSLVSGTDNVLIGSNTGEFCTMGSYNVAVGSESFATSVVGASNTLIGHNTGHAMEDGFRNVCVGRDAGSAIVDASDNVIIGPHAGSTATSPSGAILIGSYAGEIAPVLNNTILIGNDAGRNISTSANNVIGIGTSVLANVTSGLRLVAIGDEALEDITTGSDNTAVGYRAGEGVTSGSGNILVGAQTGQSIATGDNNIIMGLDAGSNIADTDENILIGHESGLNATGGTHNVGVGYQTFGNNTTGQYNTAAGSNACTSMTTGAYNAAVGNFALSACLSGDYNVSLGYKAGNSLLNTDNNVFIGKEAGIYNLSGGELFAPSDSIFIGKNSRANADGGTNEIVIGTDTIGKGSNTVKIGNSSTTETDLSGVLYLGEGQISFPTLKNPSALSYVLDDYDEGTWTPRLAFGGGSTGILYNFRLGSYTKIGRMVTAVAAFTLTSIGSDTGNATIEDLPFTSLAEGGMRWPATIALGNVTHPGDSTIAWIVSADTSLRLLYSSSASGANTALTHANFGATASVKMSITYFAA